MVIKLQYLLQSTKHTLVVALKWYHMIIKHKTIKYTLAMIFCFCIILFDLNFSTISLPLNLEGFCRCGKQKIIKPNYKLYPLILPKIQFNHVTLVLFSSVL